MVFSKPFSVGEVGAHAVGLRNKSLPHVLCLSGLGLCSRCKLKTPDVCQSLRLSLAKISRKKKKKKRMSLDCVVMLTMPN